MLHRHFNLETNCSGHLGHVACAAMALTSRKPLILALVGLWGGSFVGCTPEPDNTFEPVSEACLSCLSKEMKNGCKEPFDACEVVGSCDDYVLCQLMGQCFERKPNSGCEDDLGCVEPTNDTPDAGDSASPRELASDVEKCARSTCAKTCGFAED